jgi:hypothetical protein
MSELQQPGQGRGGQPHDAWAVHPDADQLSAFVEQALPAHERESVLAHLAVCGDCRETVAMALPPLQEENQVAEFERAGEVERVAAAAPLAAREAAFEVAVAGDAEPRRRPWIARWNVWAPAVTAVAALALVLAYVHREQQRSLREQVLNAGPQAGVQSMGQAVALAPGAAAIPATAAVEPEGKVQAKNALPHTMAPSGVAARDKTLLAEKPAAQRPQPPAPRPSGNLELEMNANRFENAASGAGAASGQAASAAPAEAPPLAGREERSVAGSLAQEQPRPAAPAAPAAPASAAQTVVVNQAGPAIDTTSPEIANASIAHKEVDSLGVPSPLPYFAKPLPSRQALLSDVSFGSSIVAIDARHNVFLSKDSGKNWKRVKSPWEGQAVRVNLVLGGTGAGMATVHGQSASLGAFAAADQLAGHGPPCVLTGTVTDMSGAVIPGATVTVTDGATGITRTAKADANGRYVVEGLPPGTYNLQAAAQGFELMQMGGIAVEGSQPNVANLSLQVRAVSETVTVEAASAETETSELRKKKAKATPVDALRPPAVFEITTDTGERWKSSDGKAWERE